jgi:outer membrane receptor protein involved in Fe transport
MGEGDTERRTPGHRSFGKVASAFSTMCASPVRSAVGQTGVSPSVLLATLVLLFCLHVSAHGQGTVGGLRGQVIDDDFRQPIADVAVRIDELGRTIQSDGDGRFFFNDVPPGTYTVTATREGYRLREPRRIAVSAGSVNEAEIEMIGEVVDLDDFVVSAEDLVSADPAALLDVRASAMAIGDVIGADFIAKVGGSDVGDVVKRIVGTSVADSRYVVIRGLSDRYNTVLLNGARIPSSDPDKRAVNIDIFPSNLVGELSNTKTFTPDLPGESTGGSINIVTKGAPEKPFVNASIGIGYNNQSTENAKYITYRGAGTGIFGTQNDRKLPQLFRGFKRDAELTQEQVEANRRDAARLLDPTTGVTTREAPLDFSLSASSGTRVENFMGGPLGVLAAFTYSKKYDFDPEVTRAQTLLAGPPGFVSPFRKFEFESQESAETLLVGLLVAGGWDPTPNNRLKLTIFANVAAEDRGFFQKGLVVGGTEDPGKVTIEDAPDVALREGLQYVERRLRTIQLSGRHDFPSLQDSSFHWTAAYSLSSQDEPDGRYSSARFNRPTQTYTQLPEFRGPPTQRYWRHLDDTNYNIVAEMRIPLFRNASGEEKALLRLGANFDYSTRDYRADTFAYTNEFLVNYPGIEDPSDSLGFTAGDVIGREASLTRLSNPEIYDASQVVAAGFAMTEFNMGKNFKVNVGLRAELTDIRVFTDPEGFFDPQTGALLGPPAVPGPTTDPFTGAPIPRDELGIANIEQVDVLPALGVTWDFQSNMKLRFAGSRTIARPSFKELAQIYITDPISTSQFRGNSALETSTIDNVDLRWEWYPSPGDVVAISAFTKFIQRPIELFTSPSFDFFANQDSAIIYGYEFEIQKNLGFLAEELRHFSIGFNGTKLYSQVELVEEAKAQRIAADLDPDRRLQGQPDYLLNFNLTYDNKDTGIFAGIFLNVTGETLYQAGSQDADKGFAADLFQQPITSLDFTLSKKLSETFKFTLRVENLVNSKVERIAEGNVDYSKSSGTKYSVSVSGAW